MKKEEVMLELYEVCRLRCYDQVANLLAVHHDKVDFALHGVQIFEFVIADQKTETLRALLDFYAKTRLQGDQESLEYKLAYKKLQSILEEASEANCVAPEIQIIIDPYLSQDESENEQDLSGFDIEESYDVQDGSHYTMHKSNSAPELLSHKTLTTSLLHSSSESVVSSTGYEIHNQDSADLVGQESQNIHFE